MIRKIFLWIIPVLLITIIIVAYLTLKGKNIEVADTLEAIPLDASIIIVCHDPHKDIRTVLEENNMWHGLLTFSSINQFHNQLMTLDSTIRMNQQVSDILKRQKITLSFHQSGKNKYDYIVYIPLFHFNNEKHIIQFIEQETASRGLITPRKYAGIKIYDVKSNGSNQINFSFTFSHGLFMASRSGILVEEAVRQLEQKSSINTQSQFIRVAGTAGQNVEANIYINYKGFPGMLTMLLKDKYRGIVSELTDFADWTELDASIRNDAVLLNGFTSWRDNENKYLHIFQKQSPQKTEIEKVIPEQIAAMVIFGLEDFRTFKQQYKQYLEIKGSLRDYQNDIEAINDKYDINLEEIFYSFIEKEAGIVITDIKNYDWEQNTFFIVRTLSRSLAEENIMKMLESIAEKEGKHISTYIEQNQIDTDVQIKVFRMPVPFLAKKLLGNAFEGINNHYCTFYDNYLIFGNSIPALSKYIHTNLLQNNLSSDLDFNKFSDFLSSRSNIYFYLDIPSSIELAHKYLDGKAAGELDKQKDHISKFQAFAYQITNEGELFYNNIFLKYFPGEISEPQTVWESRLDHPFDFKPQIVINHYTNEKEIFLQDKDQVIYLINSSGRILWKQKIDDEIMSDVYQIDFYRNGKLQYLFNTKNRIHLLDRNGNYVEKYPVDLRAPATNGIALFDYEKNGNYRIFAATEDRMIWAYNKEGQLVKGWQAERTEYNLYKPLHHFRAGNNDYLVCSDRYRVYILNRRGNIRVDVKDHFPVSRKNDFIFDSNTGGTRSRMAITDTAGHARFIYFDGQSEEVILGDFSSDHYFEYADLDGNGKKEYIFADGDELKVFNHDQKLKFSRRFKSDISHPPVLYQFSVTDIKIGIVCSQTSEIYLINSNGSIYDGFPLMGATQFSISNFSRSASRFNLIVGSEHNFLYNYSVQ